MPQPARPGRASLAAALYLLTCLLTLGGGLGLPWASAGAAVLLVAFLVLEAPRVPRIQRLVGLTLIGLGVIACAAAPKPEQLLTEGLIGTLPFLVLFAAVLCLQVPALASPSLHQVGDAIVRQPPGRRYLAVSAGAHVLGAMLNLAGLQFVASVLERAGDERVRERLALAMMRGFSAAAYWSPLFVSTAVVLSIMPGLRWPDVGPYGMALAALVIALAWTLDRLRRQASQGPVSHGPPLPAIALVKMAAVFVTLMGPVLILVEMLDIGIAIALGLVAPIFAVLWRAAADDWRMPLKDSVGLVAAHARARLPDLRAEALLFTGASLLGTGLAALARAHPELVIAPVSAVPAGLGLMALVSGITVMGLLGLHPVVPVIAIGRALPPEALGTSPALLALALMAGWGLGTMVSPVSATSMYVARLLGRPVWMVAWRWNGGYGIGASVLVGGLLAAASALR